MGRDRRYSWVCILCVNQGSIMCISYVCTSRAPAVPFITIISDRNSRWQYLCQVSISYELYPFYAAPEHTSVSDSLDLKTIWILWYQIDKSLSKFRIAMAWLISSCLCIFTNVLLIKHGIPHDMIIPRYVTEPIHWIIKTLSTSNALINAWFTDKGTKSW